MRPFIWVVQEDRSALFYLLLEGGVPWQLGWMGFRSTRQGMGTQQRRARCTHTTHTAPTHWDGDRGYGNIGSDLSHHIVDTIIRAGAQCRCHCLQMHIHRESLIYMVTRCGYEERGRAK